MAGRRTNLALLLLLSLAFLTGWLAFAFFATPARVSLYVHTASGFAIMLLLPWKSVVARRGLGRPRPARGAAADAMDVRPRRRGEHRRLAAAGWRPPLVLSGAGGFRRPGPGRDRLHRRLVLGAGVGRRAAGARAGAAAGIAQHPGALAHR